MSESNRESFMTALSQEKERLLTEKAVKVLQLQDFVSTKKYIGKDSIIPVNERTFLCWEDINYFVPTDSDPMVKFKTMTSALNPKVS
jgi:hypothetical protein